MKIGVLALQGDFAEHIAMLKRLNVETSEVRLPEHLDGLDGLIIPGGESTTIGKLAVAYNLMEPLKSSVSAAPSGERVRVRSSSRRISGATSLCSD
jgi:pyridoxal 5'-phosphate synthase pdxT subunit